MIYHVPPPSDVILIGIIVIRHCFMNAERDESRPYAIRVACFRVGRNVINHAPSMLQTK